MMVIIAGGRGVTDYALVCSAVEASGFEITEVVSGNAAGVDLLGERWAAENGVAVRLFPADWHKHGRAAGPIRNRQMAAYADALIAIPTGGPGTANMIKEAKAKRLHVYVHVT